MRYRKTAAALAMLTLGVGMACKESPTYTDANSVSSSLISNGLNKSLVQLLATGLLNNDRGLASETYLVFAETMGRDVFRIDPAEPRFITQMVGGPADPSAFSGGGVWTGSWTGVRTANTIVDDLRNKATPDMTTADTLATIGFAQTLKAIAYYRIWQMRDTLGAPINVDTSIAQYLTQPPAFHCSLTELQYLSALLDSGDVALTAAAAAGEAAFPFTMPAGFSSNGTFSTPATFDAFFNRGFKGEISLYLALDPVTAQAASYDTAITNLTTAINAGGGVLTNGVYFTYSTASGDAESPYFNDNAVHLNPQVCDSVQAGDARASKFTTLTKPIVGTNSGVSTSCQPAATIQSNPTRPVSEIRVAELDLMRAQAEIGKKNYAAAMADINTVRTSEGGLPAIVVFPLSSKGTQDSSAISAVLYEKRYSLLIDSPDRLVDLRSYSRLAAPWHKQEIPADIFQNILPIPTAEVNARAGFTTVAPVGKAPACP